MIRRADSSPLDKAEACIGQIKGCTAGAVAKSKKKNSIRRRKNDLVRYVLTRVDG